MKTANEVKIKEFSKSPLPERHSIAQNIFYRTYHIKPDAHNYFFEHATSCPRCNNEFVVLMGLQFYPGRGLLRTVMCMACFQEFLED